MGHEVIVVDSIHTGSKELMKDLDVELYEMPIHEFYKKRNWKGID